MCESVSTLEYQRLRRRRTAGTAYRQGHDLWFSDERLIENRGDAATQGYDVYDTNGNLLTADFIGPTGYGGTGIAFDGTNFLVSDIFNGKIDFYSGTTGAFINAITLFGSNAFGAPLIEDLSANYQITLGTPEPGALVLVASGLAGLVFLRKRRA